MTMTVFTSYSDVVLNRRTGLLSFDMIKAWFNQALSELELLMLDKGVDALGLTGFEGFNKEEQGRLLTCVLFSTVPPKSIPAIFSWVKINLKLSNQVLARNSCFSDDVIFIKDCLSSLSDEEIEFVFMDGNGLIINELSRFGMLQALTCLFSYRLSHGNDLQLIFKTTHFQSVIERAIKSKSLDIIKYLFAQFELSDKNAMIKDCDYKLFALGVEEGSFDITSFLLRQLSTQEEKKSAIKALDYKIIHSAAQKSNAILLRCLLMQLNVFEVKAAIKSDHFKVLEIASTYGAFECFTYLLSQLNAAEQTLALRACYERGFTTSALFGDFDMLKIFDSVLELEEKKVVIQAYDYQCLRYAISSKHYEIVHYFMSQLLENTSSLLQFLQPLGMIKTDKIEAITVCVESCERSYTDEHKSKEALMIVEYLEAQLVGDNDLGADSLRMKLSALKDTIPKAPSDACSCQERQSTEPLSCRIGLFSPAKSKAIKLPVDEENKAAELPWTK